MKHSSLLIPLLGLLVAVGPLSIDTYLPSLPEIAADLGSSQTIIQYTISTFLIGMTIGMLVFGPLSDMLGRKRLLIVGSIIYGLASIGCALIDSGESLVALRLLQSLGSASMSVLARTLVRDVFEMKRAAGILSTMHIISMLVMLVAPLLGAYIVKTLDWRWIFYLLTAFAVLALIGIALIVKEPQRDKSHTLSFDSYITSYQMALRSPIVGLFILTNGFVFGGMFMYITASAFVYIDFFGYSEATYALLFSANIGAIIAMTLINSHLIKNHSSATALRVAIIIASAATLALWLCGGLGITSVVIFMLCTMIYISVTGAIGANTLATLFMLVPERAGTAAGLQVATQFGLGALCSYITTFSFNGTPQSLLLSMACSGTLGIGCYLWARCYFQEKSQ